MGKKQHWCGFCGKESNEVERLLTGPCIEVCNECIDTMHKMIHEPKPLLPIKPAPRASNVLQLPVVRIERY